MGLIYTEIKLINVEDALLAKRSLIGLEEIKMVTTTALVDTGSIMLAINEEVQSQLQLPLVEKRTVQTADSRIQQLDVVGPVEIRFKNRKCITSAFVLPGDAEILLGAIPLEEMDVLIHPQRQELIVNPDHPYMAQLKLK